MLPKLAGAFALGVAGLVLAGESLGLEPYMRPATAVAIIGLALALLTGWRLLAAAAGLFGLVAMARGLSGPHSAVATALLGGALAFIDDPVAEIMSAAAAASALLALVSDLYGPPVSRPLSVTLLLLIAGGVLAARPDRGWMKLITGAGPGGATARRLLPAALLVPVGLGGLRVVGEELGLYRSSIGSALLVTAMVVVFALLVLLHARKLDDDEARVAASHRLLDAIIESIPHMIFMKDAARLGFVRMNRAGEELLGLERKDLLGKTDYDFFPAEQAAFFQKKDRETLEGGGMVDIVEEPIDTKQGPRWLHTKKVGLVDGGGRPQFLLGISEDITDRRRVEGERRRWAAIFERSSVAVATVSAPDGVLELMNPAFARLAGYDVGELVGQPVTRVLPAFSDQHTFEATLACKDGSELAVLVNVSTVEGFRSVNVQDVSELRRATEAAETTSRELEAFSYSVSHDLRAPLRSIDGFSAALLEDYGASLDGTAKGYLDRVRGAAQRMAELIDDLLELSRVARAEMRRERVDVTGLARAVALELAHAEPARKVAFQAQPGLVSIADTRLVRVLLTNLVGNAWKFTARRADPLVEIGHDGDGFFVRDNGAGFDMAYKDKLFGAFQRLHGATEFPGSGIGLATVQRIVHRHGGRVWAEGAVGQGATFHFTLPEEGS